MNTMNYSHFYVHLCISQYYQLHDKTESTKRTKVIEV